MTFSKTDELIIDRQSTPEGVLILRITGWLTLKNKASFEDALDKTQGQNVVLDLPGLQYMDSAGLGSLLKGYVAAQKYGGKLALAGLLPRVRDLLQLTKIEPLFQIYPTAAEAVAAFAKSAGAAPAT